MSIELMSQVWKKELSHSEQSILLSMADHADDDGESCYPSVDLTAYKTGYTPRNVVRIVNGLRERGALQVVKEGGGEKATEFRIVLDALPDKPPYPEWRKKHGRHAPNKRRGDKKSRVTSGRKTDDNSDAEPVAAVSPQPSENHNKNHHKSKDKKQDVKEGYEWFFGEG